jgi:hypothetical protein
VMQNHRLLSDLAQLDMDREDVRPIL